MNLKRILLVLFFASQMVLLHARTPIPQDLFGYWESEELNMGMYFYTDAFRMFPLDPFKERHDYSYIGIYADRKMKGDTLAISAWDAKTKFETKQYVFMEGPENLRLMHTGTGKKSWVSFQKKEMDLATLLKVLDAVDDFSLIRPNLIFEHLDWFEELTEIPEADRKILLGSKGVYGFFQHQINQDESIFRIKKVYKFKDTYLIWTYRLYAYGYGNFERVFILRPAKYNEGTYLLESESLRNFQGDFIYSEESLILTGKNVVTCAEQKEGYGLSDLPDVFFESYFDTRHLFKSWGFPLSFKLSKNGELDIGGKRYHFVRSYAPIYHPLSERKKGITGSTSIYLEVKDPETLQHKVLKIKGTSEGELRIPFSFGGEYYSFESLDGIIQNFLLYLAGLLAFILLGAFFTYRAFVLPRKLRQRLSKSQLEGIKAQLNPHFLFNSMASIQSLMNQQKTDDANQYLSELSDLLRYSLDSGAEELVLLSEELAALQQYCELESLRTPLELTMEVDTRINQDRTEIPNQILQPLVENAIKHGLRYAETPNLIIRVQKLEGSLLIHVIDNGPGIASIKEQGIKLPTLRKTHKGLALIKEKMSIMRKKGMKMNLQVLDRQHELGHSESGTQASVEIPLNY